jgi:glyoxylase-like metal-dependent hydrolase (beta-lactamase superfamily II)
MRLGQFEITALWDGTLDLPVDKIFHGRSGRIRSLLSQSYLSNEVTLTVNAFLMNTGMKLVLIDTGTGTSQMFGSKLGRLLSNLQASGYSPEQVEEIYVTHMHTDHIGGLMRDGKPGFTNATVRANVREADFYLSQSRKDAPADEREDFESAMTISAT